MEEIIENLENLASNDISSEITTALIDFRSKIYTKSFINFTYSERCFLFKRLWLIFLRLSNNKNSSVRLTTCTTITAFLTKVYPYFPKELRHSFSEVMNEADLDDSSSSILVASFAFLTNFITPQFLNLFLDSTPVFHHFFQVSSLSSERLASIVSNIPWLGDEWFSTVFAAFVNQTLKNCSRNTLSASLALFKRAPKVLMRLLLQLGDEGHWEMSYVTVLSFILSGSDFDVNKIEKEAFAQAQESAFHLLEADTSEAIKNDCFTVLSALKWGLKVEKDENNLKVSLNGEEVSFDYTPFINDPKFFLLPLPYSMLEPKEDDFQSIVQAKMESIGRAVSVAEKGDPIFELAISIMDKVSRDPKTKTITLYCINKCANRILSIMEDNTVFPALVHRCIFCKEESWFHASLILKTLTNIDHRLFKRAFGSNGEALVRKRILGFTMNANEGLSNEAIKALVALSKHYFEELAVEVWLDTDYFDNRSLAVHLKIMSQLLGANPTKDVSFLTSFSDSLYEIEETTDLELISLVFLVQSYFDNGDKNNARVRLLIEAAANVILSAMEILTGSHPEGSIINHNLFFEMTSNLLSKHAVDITDVGAADFKKQYAPIYAACKFLLSLPIDVLNRNFAIKSCTSLFKFFPDVCTDYIIRNIREFSENDRVRFVSKCFIPLVSVADPHVHAQWAEIALFPMPADKLPKDFYKSMTDEALYFIRHSAGIAPDDLYSFCALLGAFPEQNDEEIKKFLMDLPIKSIHTFVSLSHNKFIGLVNRFPEEFKHLSQVELENSDAENIHIIAKSSKHTQEEIECCRKHLKGLDLILFEQSLIKKEKKIDTRTVSERLIDAMNTRNKEGVDTLLSLLSISHEKIDFSSMNIPDLCISSVIHHLEKWDKDQIAPVLDHYSIADIGTDRNECAFYYCCYNYEKAIDDMFALDKLHKKHLSMLVRCLDFNNNISQSQRIVDRILSGRDYTEKKLSYALIILTCIIESDFQMNEDTKNRIFQFIQINSEKCDTKVISRLFFSLSMYTNALSAFDIPIIEYYYNLSGKNTKEHCYLLLTVANISVKCNADAKYNIKDVISALLQRNIPSGIHSVTSTLEAFVTNMSPEKTIDCFKNTFIPMSDLCFNEHSKNPIVVDWVSRALAKVFQNDGLRLMQAQIAYDFVKYFKVDNSGAMLTYYTICSPEIMKVCRQFTQTFREIYLYTSKISLSNSLKVYLSSQNVLGVILSRYTNIEKRNNILNERVTSWLDGKKGFDSYYCLEFYSEWLKYIVMYLPIDEVSQLVTMLFVKHIQRFYVFLVILKRAMNAIKAEEERNQFIETLKICIPMIQNEEHQRAVTALINGDSNKILNFLNKCCFLPAEEEQN